MRNYLLDKMANKLMVYIKNEDELNALKVICDLNDIYISRMSSLKLTIGENLIRYDVNRYKVANMLEKLNIEYEWKF